ncbi:transketolase [Marinicella rhabdoformis]|uniref:transketolase n=1 Tax=Marinicella rhabdoformis TaxID=2580566 RepID=UPI0012AEDDDE|nr:transketolase [Marinicella rhabdoformis]
MTDRKTLANAIRVLAMDAVQQANSGHPGAPMGMADIAEVLFNDFLTHNPKNPDWINRDRFVMSNGHGSMLPYAALHLSGYDLSIDDLKQFRQLHSKTPGHPEYGYTPGIETTTGPLGQGIANAVGMALAEKSLAAIYNKPGHDIVDHHSYVFLGDGCLMEGISHEVCSLAGTLKLGKLIAIYDDNNISIDGEVDGWFTDDTVKRFEAYNWQVLSVDGHDADALKAALEQAQQNAEQPTIICAKTVIGSGAPNKAGSHDCHGAPLGADEIQATREALGWTHGPFEIPAEIKNAWDATIQGEEAESNWNAQFAAYKKAYPELAAEFERRMSGDLPHNWNESADAFIAKVAADAPELASRQASKLALEGFGPHLPEFFGGSADLTPSNNTFWSGSKSINEAVVNDTPYDGNYLSYGVREFGMSAIMNGMALHGGFIPYGATFLMFSEYARNALRMAALMKIRSIFVYTHDSIGVGEDGPTHQPVEQTPTLRLIPNMHVWRPCDAVESAVSWRQAVEKIDGPSCLLFTRQGVKHQDRTEQQIADIAKGGYVLADCSGEPELIIIATGSEVGISMEATQALKAQGKKVRLVSMPSAERFEEQSAEYKASVLPAQCDKRIAVEAAQGDFWYKYVGLNGRVIAQNTFGESAPGNVLFKHFGFTVEHVIEQANELLA